MGRRKSKEAEVGREVSQKSIESARLLLRKALQTGGLSR